MAQELSIQKDEKQITYTYLGTPKFMTKQGYSLFILMFAALTIGGCTVGSVGGFVMGGAGNLTPLVIGAAIGIAVAIWLVKKWLTPKLFHKQGTLQIKLDEGTVVTHDGKRIPIDQIHTVRTEHIKIGGDAKGAELRRTLVFVDLQNGSSVQLTHLLVSDTTADRIYADMTGSYT